MKRLVRFAFAAVAAAALLGLGGCSGMSTLDQNAAIGPVEGGIPGQTRRIGGPVIGGIVGHETLRPR